MNRRGQSLLESALAIVVLLMVILAVVDFAQVSYTQQALSERVRMAARRAALESLTDDAITDEVIGTGFPNLQREHIRVTRTEGESASVRVSIIGYRYALISAFRGGSIAAREISHSEPVEVVLPGEQRDIAQRPSQAEVNQQ